MTTFDDDPMFAAPSAPAVLYYFLCRNCGSLRAEGELSPAENRHACRDTTACAERAARRVDP